MADVQGSAANDTAAALVASLLTSVIEAPVELFRHRMQVTHTSCFQSSRNMTNLSMPCAILPAGIERIFFCATHLAWAKIGIKFWRIQVQLRRAMCGIDGLL